MCTPCSQGNPLALPTTKDVVRFFCGQAKNADASGQKFHLYHDCKVKDTWGRLNQSPFHPNVRVCVACYGRLHVTFILELSKTWKKMCEREQAKQPERQKFACCGKSTTHEHACLAPNVKHCVGCLDLFHSDGATRCEVCNLKHVTKFCEGNCRCQSRATKTEWKILQSSCFLFRYWQTTKNLTFDRVQWVKKVKTF